MKPEHIAAIAHQINTAYCIAIGDKVAPPFEECPEDMQKGIMLGVQMHIDNPEATPEQSHESWLADKIANGWTYGEVKDIEAKTHPCCVPYADLPESQKAKDYLFRAVVHALKDIPDADEDPDGSARVAELESQLNETTAKLAAVLEQVEEGGVPILDNGVAIKYIGKRESYTDRLYGTGLMFTQGQVRSVPGELARRFLSHRDLFEKSVAPAPASDDTRDMLQQNEDEKKEKERKEQDLANLHREIDNLDKNGLIQIGERYGVKLAKNATNAKVAEARAAIHQKIDQFGAV